MPVFPADQKGMMISAVEDNNPVIIIEHRWTHYLKGDVPKGYYKSDISGPKKLASGKDCTIVASSYSVVDALKATHALQNLGITVDLFDLRVIRPLNLESIKASVANTGTLLVIDTGFKTLGIGAEIVAQVVESEFQSLTKPPLRMGLPDHPIPSSRGYMPDLYPDAEKIFDAVLSLSKKQPTSDEQAAAVKETLASNTVPIDIPDSSFQGPF
jgi:pyruvate dehydrogenase E1 component beta subunit